MLADREAAFGDASAWSKQHFWATLVFSLNLTTRCSRVANDFSTKNAFQSQPLFTAVWWIKHLTVWRGNNWVIWCKVWWGLNKPYEIAAAPLFDPVLIFPQAGTLSFFERSKGGHVLNTLRWKGGFGFRMRTLGEVTGECFHSYGRLSRTLWRNLSVTVIN